MNQTTTKILLSLILLSFCLFPERQVFANFFTDKFHIHVKNGLSDNQNLLRIHCQSKNDDLGFHDLNVGEEFEWSFRVNFQDTTLYFCHFWWKNLDASFDTFNFTFARRFCGTSPNVCYWLVKENGFYFSGLNNPSIGDYSWTNAW